MDRLPSSVATRRVVVGLAVVGGIVVLARVPRGDWSVLSKFLPGLGGLLGGVVLMAPELVRWTLAPFSNLVDSILMPSETVVPPADLKLARSYGQSLRYEEASEEYARILQYHPDHTEACLEGIRAAGLAGDERQARKFHLAARRVLRARDQRRLLENVYEARHQPLEHLEATISGASPEEPLDRP